MVVADTAEAGYADEQKKREILQDSEGLELELSHMSEFDVPSPPVCSQCIHWRSERSLDFVDASTGRSAGFCTASIAADLSQISQDYASSCELYKADIPF